MVSYYFISKKQYEFSNNTRNFFSRIFSNNEISKKLKSLSYPHGINELRYILIKYVISSITFIIILLRDRNIILSVLVFLLFYFLPDIIIKSFINTENYKLINQISNIVQSLILSLSSNMSLQNSLKISVDSIDYIRLKIEYENFINKYYMYNFNMSMALSEFRDKFKSSEMGMFLSILEECEKEGRIIENLEAFSEVLDYMYFKYEKYKTAKISIFMSLATVFCLINILIVVMYPIFIQILENLSEIFS